MTRRLLQALGRARLSTRFVTQSLLLLLAVQLAGFAAIRVSIERNARATLADELQVGERVWQRLLEQRAQKYEQAAALLAADYGFRAAVSEGDAGTQASALENHAARIGAPLAALLDTQFALRAHSGDAGSLALLQQVAPRLAGKGRAAVADGQRVLQFVMVPIKAPVAVGWVVMGFPIDQALLDDMHALSGLHVGLRIARADTPAPLVLSTLSPSQAQALARHAATTGSLNLNGDQCLVREVAGGAEAGAPPWQALLLRSVDEALAPLQSLQLTLAGITAAGVLLFGLGSAWAARRVARPLGRLVQASEQLASGDYSQPLQAADGADAADPGGSEVADLARAFDHMRLNIGQQQQQIRQLAYWDRLTGLPNRIQLREATEAALAQGPAALLVLGLDRFKHVNSVLGHAMGDRLLQAVAQRLAPLAEGNRGLALVARLGGDEFALLLPGANAAQAQARAADVAQRLAQPLQLDEQMVDVSAGVGMAIAPGHGQDADTLLAHAELAMVAAKRRSAGALMYDPASDTASAQTLSLLTELRQALRRQELRLYLQPKVQLAAGARQGQAVAVEALVRWQHPQRGLVPPLQFIPFAEQTGFIRELTLWMFEQCAMAAGALAEQGVVQVSINLSTRDLMDHELPARLDSLLRRHGARASAFCLEITESAIMDDPQRAQATLQRLADAGFKLSIDDFGTGYSSLAYLKQLPVHELKIDKSFVMAMDQDRGDAMIVRSTIELAHNLGLSVVAEGVENAGIVRALQTLGCDQAQGYHYSKPVPLDDMLAWLQRQGAAVPA
ncbi:diguanylate cyclase (GGDEF) domain-containing protein [Burkholderiales bacterium JOSHI_001]|nr:diguanylate cyclase (GGDEF) domain-containing protein [Burkholderiales bacterium JOSHI_001]